MLVSELITQLQKCDQDAHVLFENEDDEHGKWTLVKEVDSDVLQRGR